MSMLPLDSALETVLPLDSALETVLPLETLRQCATDRCSVPLETECR
jgi:hypothetical protein